MAERIGFIGLGIMGRAMAQNILNAGFPLTVWNRTVSRSAELVAAGATLAESPAALAAQSDIIISCVSDSPDVEAVLLGENGAIYGAQPGSLVIDMSTISPQATRTIGETLAASGIAMLDAPMSGGSEGAAKGTLSIMVGGATADVERAHPVFEAMGNTITHVGERGDGQTVKLANQILVVGNALAMAEALLFAQASGANLQHTYDSLKNGAAGSWMFTNRAPQILQRDWRPGFTIDLQVKDLRLALAAAEEVGVPLLATALSANLYRTLQQRGLGEEGNHALIKALEALSGFEVGSEQ